MKPKATLRHFLALAGSSLLAISSASAATRTWGGGSLDWTNTSASGWNAAVPVAADTATINSGTVTVTTNITTGNTPGTINLDGGMLVISTGKLVGGTFTTGKTFTIGSGATLRLNSWGYDVAGSLGALDYGRGRLVVNGGIIELTGNSSESGRNFTVGTGGATLRSSMNSGQTWTLQRDSNSLYHDIQVNSGRTLTLDGTGNGRIENNLVTTTGTGNIAKAGSGTWTLAAPSTYNGTTTVSAGTLLINNTTGSGTGSSAVTVEAGGTLGGNGTISGAVTVDGALKPGNSTGLLTVGSLALNASSSTTLEINGTNRGAVSNGYDALSVNTGGSIDLGGALVFEFGNLAAFAANTEFDLFSFTTTSTGDFSGVTSTGFYTGTWNKTGDIWALTDEGQTLNFSEATGNLTVIPEPSAALLGGLGLMFLLRRRR